MRTHISLLVEWIQREETWVMISFVVYNVVRHPRSEESGGSSAGALHDGGLQRCEGERVRQQRARHRAAPHRAARAQRQRQKSAKRPCLITIYNNTFTLTAPYYNFFCGGLAMKHSQKHLSQKQKFTFPGE